MANVRISALLALLGLSMSIAGCVADASDAEDDTEAEEAAGANNLLKHGDFEGVKDGAPPPAWNVKVGGQTGIDWAWVDKRSGFNSKRGLRVMDFSDAGERITVSQIVPVKGQVTYHLTARTRRVAADSKSPDDNGSSQRLVLEFLDANKTLLTNPSCNAPAKYCHATHTVDPPMSTTNFARVSIGTAGFGAVVPIGAHYIRVSIKGNGSSKGEYRDWDNIILTEVPWGGY